MFDIRPVDSMGDLDMERINKVAKKEKARLRKDREEFKKEIIEFNEEDKTENVKNAAIEFKNVHKEEFVRTRKEKQKKKFSIKIPWNWNNKKLFLTLGTFSLVILILLGAANFIYQGLKVKNTGLEKGQLALSEITQAAADLKAGDFKNSQIRFSNAHQKLTEISNEIDKMGSFLVATTRYFPKLSKVSSADYLVSAGEDISQIGLILSNLLEKADNIKSQSQSGETISYLKLFQETEGDLNQITTLLESAQKNLNKVNVDDFSEEQRSKIIWIKKILPEINNAAQEFSRQEKILVDILGGNGPRKYLFLFQNNQEMRATGGFIGSYGLLDIFNGRVRNFFIDGIFNPDGQLQERIVPPSPIQKISDNWSLHDSNWFPDFPQSAEKAAWFYEKTGGPTVDGVITMTPTVMQKLLSITGPIEMPEYEITIDKDNFIEKVQYKVEDDYNQEENKPKKILADLAPKVLDEIFNSDNFLDLSKTLSVLLESLNEKQILIYSKNWEIEKVLSQNNWSGEILDTPKDYLSVVNTNINGFKTDGVVEEKINHQAEIQSDGTIIDTVTVTRKHNGGNTSYDWWNRVNADYMRVYVPKGSILLSASGQTREFNSPPLDYDALGYKRDAQLQMEENSIEVDEESGTRIYENENKTVFANWVYVSPQETVTVKYKYKLPFKVDLEGKDSTDSYSILFQKQSGSLGSHLTSDIVYPENWQSLWQYPENQTSLLDDLPENTKGIRLENVLNLDRFAGIAFSK